MSATLEKALRALLSYSKRLQDFAISREARLSLVWHGTQRRPAQERWKILREAVDKEIAEQESLSVVPVPCKAGCNHCCSFQEIVVSVAEAVEIVKHIELRMSVDRRNSLVKSILASSTTGLGKDTPCALMSDGGCSVYSSRPIPCRTYFSLSEPACRACRMAGAPFPTSSPDSLPVRTHVVGMIAMKVSRAYSRSGRYEINSLLRRIYSTSGTPQLWACDKPTDESDIAKLE